MRPLADKPHITWPLIAALLLTYAAILGWYFWPSWQWMTVKVDIVYVEGAPKIEYARTTKIDAYEVVYVAELNRLDAPASTVCVSNKAPFDITIAEGTPESLRKKSVPAPPKGYKYAGTFYPSEWMRDSKCHVLDKPGRYEIIGAWCRRYIDGECIDPIEHDPLGFEVR